MLPRLLILASICSLVPFLVSTPVSAVVRYPAATPAHISTPLHSASSPIPTEVPIPPTEMAEDSPTPILDSNIRIRPSFLSRRREMEAERQLRLTRSEPPHILSHPEEEKEEAKHFEPEIEEPEREEKNEINDEEEKKFETEAVDDDDEMTNDDEFEVSYVPVDEEFMDAADDGEEDDEGFDASGVGLFHSGYGFGLGGFGYGNLYGGNLYGGFGEGLGYRKGLGYGLGGVGYVPRYGYGNLYGSGLGLGWGMGSRYLAAPLSKGFTAFQAPVLTTKVAAPVVTTKVAAPLVAPKLVSAPILTTKVIPTVAVAAPIKTARVFAPAVRLAGKKGSTFGFGGAEDDLGEE